jgi:5-methylthioadenosine/S-adenosylhomocysteine deaminase
MSESPADLVITGCTVLVHGEHERIGFEEDAANRRRRADPDA